MPLWLLLKFLGAGILKFIKDNWKWALPLLAAIGLYFVHVHQVKEAYNNGRVEMSQAIKKKLTEKIIAENKKNREQEARNADDILEYNAKLENERAERIVKETSYLETIQKILDKNPGLKDCKVPRPVIDELNDIRRLGPSE